MQSPDAIISFKICKGHRCPFPKGTDGPCCTRGNHAVAQKEAFLDALSIVLRISKAAELTRRVDLIIEHKESPGITAAYSVVTKVNLDGRSHRDLGLYRLVGVTSQ